MQSVAALLSAHSDRASDLSCRKPTMGAIHSYTHTFFDTLLPKPGGHRDAHFSRRKSHGERLGGGWLMAAEREPPLGSHIVTPRRGYLHHGIYVGGGTVVHYAGLAYGVRRGPVEEIPLARFACGRPIRVSSDASPKFDCREVICRARSRIGEDRYCLLSNNCEHFCEWCLRGDPRSYQVEAWLAHRGRALRAMIHFVALWLSRSGGVRLSPAGPVSTNHC